jgi:hypothetical protein
MGLGVSLETEVENGNGTMSMVTNVISNQAVAQAQQIISSASDKPESEQMAAICELLRNCIHIGLGMASRMHFIN